MRPTPLETSMPRTIVSLRTHPARRAPALAALLAALALAACATDEEQSRITLPTTAQPIARSNVSGFEKAYSVGHVILAGQPTPLQLANARDAGIKVVINLRPQSEMSFDEASIATGLRMRYVSIPFKPDTLGDAQAQAFIQEIRKGDGPVLVHCGTGDRAAGIWAVYEITDLKVKPEEAVARARTLGLRSPEMIAYIGDYARRIGAW
jgi:uncharacterized protein (TIGR01244 family)